MANIRKDEKSVYIDLWGETLEYDRIQYALYQLNSAFELRISEDIDTILNYRLNGVPYKVSTVNGQQTYKNEQVVLFLGAGVSIDAGVPLWDELIDCYFEC